MNLAIIKIKEFLLKIKGSMLKINNLAFNKENNG